LAGITEYSLVVLVSTLFVGASVETYGTYAKFEGMAEFNASFSALVVLASQAAVNGSSRSTLLVPSLVVSCEGGSFSVRSNIYRQTQRLPVGCDFAIEVEKGIHAFEFSAISSNLSLEVS